MAAKDVVLQVSSLVTESMNEKLRKIYRDEITEFGNRPTIYRVSHDVRVDDTGAYEPKIISIGPYHHGLETLQPMEAIKWEYLHDLLARNQGSQNDKLRKYSDVVSACEPNLRSRYSDIIDLSPEKFVELLILDGCFIIEFLLKREEGKQQKENRGKSNSGISEKRNLPLLRHDLLLLENQVPFSVLEKISDEMGLGELYVLDLIIDFLTKGKMSKEEILSADDVVTVEKPIQHILHVYHLCLLQGIKQKANTPKISPGEVCLVKIKSAISRIFIGILYFLVSIFQTLILRRPICLTDRNRLKSIKSTMRIIPSATELEESGVSFIRNLDVTGTCFYMNVSFNGGDFWMPYLSLENFVNSEFRNLLAFEQTYPHSGSNFTSYVTLMCNILDSAGDVAILRRARILENNYGSDKEVAQMFNSLRSVTNLSVKKPHYLSGEFEKLNRYCESDRHRWRAALVNDYFSSPWTIISFSAAVFLIGLTCLQTIYAILTYYLQPNT
ncbi:hypothetical protein ZOSMA_37G00850 [Zostera marina]|uniref:Uncharacterized protein n=1 Tax=Zostera marina TaxID=29655 RepID=A0A0K9P7R8_ZOSMR|nr:hypothetical protein ZOSMA_37G00850 [Zostera marina]